MDRRGPERAALGVSWFHFRAMFSRKWGDYLVVVVLVGLIGGIAMGSIIAARLTQSSYPTFLASTNPSNLTVTVYGVGGNPGPSFAPEIARLHDVRHVGVLVAPSFVPLAPNGAPRLGTLGDVIPVGSTDGVFLTQDRLAVVEGRMVDPRREDEIVTTSTAARIYKVHVGDTVPLGFYTSKQKASPLIGTPAIRPRLRVDARLVGIVDLNNQVVQDDIDRAYGIVYLPPALIDRALALDPTQGEPVGYDLQLAGGRRSLVAVEGAIARLVPKGFIYQFHSTARTVAEVELAIKPESVALGGFGAIAALVCIVVGAESISRLLRSETDDRRVLRALGASRFGAAGGGLIGALLALVAGAVVAFGLAVALSPLAPLGPVRAVYPDRGFSFDWTVLGAGVAVLVVVLGVVVAAISYRNAPHRLARIGTRVARDSKVVRVAERAGLPQSAVVGVRFAVEPGGDRGAAPARSVLAGTVLAVLLVVASLTFASGLATLVSHPALYGWNWNYLLNPTNNLPMKAASLLDHDPDVAAWSGYAYNNVSIDGLNVPALITTIDPRVAPPILSGHGLETTHEIVLGEATLAALGKRVGDFVTLSYLTPKDGRFYVPPTRLKVVGTATFPAVGFESTVADHTSMGVGALFPYGALPRASSGHWGAPIRT